MTDNFSNSQQVRKPAVISESGVVAAQHIGAARVGAQVLNQGGDAVDAAIATSLALGVLEPWMSGLAAGGCMVLWRAQENRAQVINFGMRAPLEIDPANYPLSGLGTASDLFPWPNVVDDRNVKGATAVAVPGMVAGLGLAHQTFGRLPWADLVQPAVELASQGMLTDWYSALMTGANARALSEDPDAAAYFLDDGKWPIVGGWTAVEQKRLKQQTLAATLQTLAQEGPDAFYRGRIGQDLVRDVRAKGGCLSLEDLSLYQAELVEPLHFSWDKGTIFASPALTGGPTLLSALERLCQSEIDSGEPGARTYQAMAQALDQAFQERLNHMGDHESPASPGSTTHFSVVDSQGNLCSVTQTLLSVFGSKVVSPATGLVLNNGIMWFDPEPGKPNSLAPGKRCLTNYSPIIGQGSDGRLFALGASGGRKILGAVMQIASYMLNHGMSLEEAFHQPRIDVSGNGKVIADPLLSVQIQQALAAVLPTSLARRHVYPYAYACPAGVSRFNGQNMGCTEIYTPWGDAVAAQR
jgi:gamma-glutamyltranspeptidase / glutathione hydrolase